MFDTIARGGILMLPLLFCSVLALAIVLERLWVLWRSRRTLRAIERSFNTALERGDLQGARRAVGRNRDFLSRMLRDSIGGREVVDPDEPQRFWRRRMGALGTIATIAPMIGLLGTVVGMIAAFQEIQNLADAGQVAGPGDLAGGIWEALLTTAAGMVVAIPCYVLHSWLAASINRLIEELESTHDRCLREYRKHEAAADSKAVKARPVRRRVA